MVQRRQPCRAGVPAVQGGPVAAFASQFLAGGIVVDEVLERIGQGALVPHGHQPGRVAEHLFQRARGAGYYRGAAGHGLQGRQAEALVARRVSEDGGPLDEGIAGPLVDPAQPERPGR